MNAKLQETYNLLQGFRAQGASAEANPKEVHEFIRLAARFVTAASPAGDAVIGGRGRKFEETIGEESELASCVRVAESNTEHAIDCLESQLFEVLKSLAAAAQPRATESELKRREAKAKPNGIGARLKAFLRRLIPSWSQRSRRVKPVSTQPAKLDEGQQDARLERVIRLSSSLPGELGKDIGRAAWRLLDIRIQGTLRFRDARSPEKWWWGLERMVRMLDVFIEEHPDLMLAEKLPPIVRIRPICMDRDRLREIWLHGSGLQLFGYYVLGACHRECYPPVSDRRDTDSQRAQSRR
jgi:hypothetical protein